MKRRLSWFGHLMRLPPETPARQSLRHFIKPVKCPTGRPKTTKRHGYQRFSVTLKNTQALPSEPQTSNLLYMNLNFGVQTEVIGTI